MILHLVACHINLFGFHLNRLIQQSHFLLNVAFMVSHITLSLLQNPLLLISYGTF